jgi:predicted nuclease of predicted toxin-antitoxin system
MHLLADENIARAVVTALRVAGHDVAWTREDAPGSSDEAVLDFARLERRVLITCDKDFGELAFRRGLTSSSGVILFRIAAESPARLAEAFVRAVASRTDWAGHFSVIEHDRIRMTVLPA